MRVNPGETRDTRPDDLYLWKGAGRQRFGHTDLLNRRVPAFSRRPQKRFAERETADIRTLGPTSRCESPAARGRAARNVEVGGAAEGATATERGSGGSGWKVCGSPGRAVNDDGAVRWAVEAAVCGALGCRETDGLLSVRTEEGERVLCAEHAAGWMRR